MQQRVGKGAAGCVCVFVMGCLVGCYGTLSICHYQVVNSDVGGGADIHTQKSTILHTRLREKGMPISLYPSLFPPILFFHILHLFKHPRAILPSVPDLQ